MKNFSLKLVVLLICVLFFVSCEKPIVKREYYDTGIVKVEELFDRENKIISRKEYYENGDLAKITNFTDGMKDGLFYSYSLVGKVLEEVEYDMGEMVGFVDYDYSGNIKYWKRNLTENDIPTFKDEFIQIVSYDDNGLAVNLAVPGISPFQISPFSKNAETKSIDIINGSWLIIPSKDSVELAIRIEMTDSNFLIMESKLIIISELQ